MTYRHAEAKTSVHHARTEPRRKPHEPQRNPRHRPRTNHTDHAMIREAASPTTSDTGKSNVKMPLPHEHPALRRADGYA